MERTGQARWADIDVTCDLIARKWESRPDSGAFRPPFWAQVGQFGLILCWKPDAHVQDVAKIGQERQKKCQEIAFSIFDLSWHFSWHFWCLSCPILGHLGRPDSAAFRPPFWAWVGQFGLRALSVLLSGLELASLGFCVGWKPDAHVQDVAKIVPR